MTNINTFLIENESTENKIISHTPPSLNNTSRKEIREYFKNTWNLYELLFDSIIDDASYYQSPDPLRNPLIFYFGHTAAFYVNKLELSGIINEGLNRYFEDIFAKGVDPENPKDLDHKELWPSVGEVKNYRKNVYDLLLNIIDKIDIPNQITSNHQLWAILMGIEHDRIHFETSSVLIRQLNVHLVKKPQNWHYAPTFGKNNDYPWIHVESGSVKLGKQEPAQLYGWDNEYGSLPAIVKPFYATKNLISNGDYLNFVKSGAYNNSLYWCEEGLNWKKRTQTEHPKFWIRKENDDFAYRAMFDFIEMPLDWPIEVNKFETLAYIAYKGKNCRLLTEKEFQLIAKNEYNQEEPVFNNNLNLNLKFGSPTPVGYFSNHKSKFNDLFGNVWDWLDDDFSPLPGFKTHPWYKDFSQPYFDDRHSMLLGGSWATTGTSASKFYRLWFRDYFYQHAGFRLAKSVN